MRTSVARCLGLLLFALLTMHHGTQAQAPTTYNLTLSHAESAVDASGRIVLTMMAKGDLQGAFTLKFERSADGTVTGGEWAFVVSYTEIIPGPPPVPGGEEDPGEALVQKGVLKGSVSGGSITVNENGSLSTLTGVQLEVTGGTLAYQAVSRGTGTVDGSNISNRDESTASIALIF